MVDESGKLPKRRVKCVGELWLTLMRVINVSIDLFTLYLLLKFVCSFLLFKRSVNILEVFFFTIT